MFSDQVGRARLGVPGQGASQPRRIGFAPAALSISEALAACYSVCRSKHADAPPKVREKGARGGDMASFILNGKAVAADADAQTPLLWIIRDHIGLTGTKYGCGAGLCGACTVHVDGRALRSCQTPLASVEGAKVVTIEGLSPDASHPLQRAWVAEQVPQCGYCQSGQIMKAAELLARNPKPSRDEIIAHMDGNICRCGTYPRIVAAVERAAREG